MQKKAELIEMLTGG